jgi:hypothetical protein
MVVHHVMALMSLGERAGREISPLFLRSWWYDEADVEGQRKTDCVSKLTEGNRRNAS